MLISCCWLLYFDSWNHDWYIQKGHLQSEFWLIHRNCLTFKSCMSSFREIFFFLGIYLLVCFMKTIFHYPLLIFYACHTSKKVLEKKEQEIQHQYFKLSFICLVQLYFNISVSHKTCTLLVKSIECIFMLHYRNVSLQALAQMHNSV